MNPREKSMVGYLAYGQEELIDNSQLPDGSLVCEACSWPSDEVTYDESLRGKPCSMCGGDVP